MAKRIQLALVLILMAALLCGCGYWVVEDAPIQVGDAYIQPEDA